MKALRRLFLIFSLVIFALSAASFMSSARLSAQRHAGGREPMAQEQSYILRCDNGKVCVYENGSDQPIGRLNIDPADLPEDDRRLLECGILVQNRSQLMSLLEDYSS